MLLLFIKHYGKPHIGRKQLSLYNSASLEFPLGQQDSLIGDTYLFAND
jgi:hypothetical protein